jgi:hypothetical protein
MCGTKAYHFLRKESATEAETSKQHSVWTFRTRYLSDHEWRNNKQDKPDSFPIDAILLTDKAKNEIGKLILTIRFLYGTILSIELQICRSRAAKAYLRRDKNSLLDLILLQLPDKCDDGDEHLQRPNGRGVMHLMLSDTTFGIVERYADKINCFVRLANQFDDQDDPELLREITVIDSQLIGELV